MRSEEILQLWNTDFIFETAENKKNLSKPVCEMTFKFHVSARKEDVQTFLI